jgi:hypothetical protein
VGSNPTPSASIAHKQLKLKDMRLGARLFPAAAPTFETVLRQWLRFGLPVPFRAGLSLGRACAYVQGGRTRAQLWLIDGRSVPPCSLFSKVHDKLRAVGSAAPRQNLDHAALLDRVDPPRAMPGQRLAASLRAQRLKKVSPVTYGHIGARVTFVGRCFRHAPQSLDLYERCRLRGNAQIRRLNVGQCDWSHDFSEPSGEPLALAGLWEQRREPESGKDTLSATIVVGPANAWTCFTPRLRTRCKKGSFRRA